MGPQRKDEPANDPQELTVSVSKLFKKELIISSVVCSSQSVAPSSPTKFSDN